MGDYTRNNVKIGTCGRAYYSTRRMLMEYHDQGDPEVRWYLDPVNKAEFAFPFPEWDHKRIGTISSIHTDQCIRYHIGLSDSEACTCGCKDHILTGEQYTGSKDGKTVVKVECSSCRRGYLLEDHDVEYVSKSLNPKSPSYQYDLNVINRMREIHRLKPIRTHLSIDLDIDKWQIILTTLVDRWTDEKLVGDIDGNLETLINIIQKELKDGKS